MNNAIGEADEPSISLHGQAIERSNKLKYFVVIFDCSLNTMTHEVNTRSIENIFPQKYFWRRLCRDLCFRSDVYWGNIDEDGATTMYFPSAICNFVMCSVYTLNSTSERRQCGNPGFIITGFDAQGVLEKRPIYEQFFLWACTAELHIISKGSKCSKQGSSRGRGVGGWGGGVSIV